jgi:uncharacterized protein
MFEIIKGYMYECMDDSAHDSEHIFRVLYTALHIAEKTGGEINYDVLIAAALLHDTARNEQFANPALCHAREGGKKAKAFLLKHDWDEGRAEHVNQCISTHRFRGDNVPESAEAKILFDADKLDASGCLGIARTLMYQGCVGEPIYSAGTTGVSDGKDSGDPASFYKEYHFKLKNLYAIFYTEAARRVAEKRKKAAELFFSELCSEVDDSYRDENLIGGFLSE